MLPVFLFVPVEDVFIPANKGLVLYVGVGALLRFRFPKRLKADYCWFAFVLNPKPDVLRFEPEVLPGALVLKPMNRLGGLYTLEAVYSSWTI